MKAPFPWFGGKSRIAARVWRRFGDVKNYVEPFAGSLAVLLARPHKPKVETVNDKDHYIANFWRSLKNDPEQVAWWADWPVNEADLNAKKDFLKKAHRNGLKRVLTDMEYYDPKVAGIWVWAVCQSIGDISRTYMPHLGDPGKGVHRSTLPHLGPGKGVHRSTLPHLGNPGTGVAYYLQRLSERLRRVRVCCGDWSRVLTSSVTTKHGLTAVFLDPPYRSYEAAYTTQECDQDALLFWCRENESDPNMRIALCGYEGDYDLPGWDVVSWKASRGYADAEKNKNRTRERVWFSPHCLKSQKDLFR